MEMASQKLILIGSVVALGLLFPHRVWSQTVLRVPQQTITTGQQTLPLASISPDGQTIMLTTSILPVQAKLEAYTRVGEQWVLESEDPILILDYAALLSAHAFSGDSQTFAVGAAGDTVYVFTRSSTGWSERTTIVNPRKTDDTQDGFGNSIAINGAGDVLAVDEYDPEGATSDEYVYIYIRQGSTWTLRDEIKVTEEALGTLSLNESGDRLLAGNQLYEYAGEAWRARRTFSSYSTSSTMSRNGQVIGISDQDRVFVYEAGQGDWAEMDTLVWGLQSDNAIPTANWDGSVIAVTVPEALAMSSGPLSSDIGRAYLFSRAGTTGWTKSAIYGPPNDALPFNGYGTRIDLGGLANVLVVSAYGSGHVYLYTPEGTAREEVPVNLGLQVSIYPTPFETSITFTLEGLRPGAFTIEVFDSLGRRVHERRGVGTELGSTNEAMNGSDWSNGIYFYRVTQDGDVRTGTLVRLL